MYVLTGGMPVTLSSEAAIKLHLKDLSWLLHTRLGMFQIRRHFILCFGHDICKLLKKEYWLIFCVLEVSY